MKKFSFARIMILVLSLALLIGSVVAVSASAEEAASTGKFGALSLAYNDNVALQVVVDATQEEIENGTVKVTYSVNNGDEIPATYFRTTEDGRVWVITGGFPYSDLAQVVTFNSYVGDTQVEFNRTCSAAQFIYYRLYVDSTTSEARKNYYNSILIAGRDEQLAFDKNPDALVTDSTHVYTKNADIKIGGKTYGFAPAADLKVAPTYIGEIPAGQTLVGWNVTNRVVTVTTEETEDGTTTTETVKYVDAQVGLSFTASGVVEIKSPIFIENDSDYILENGGFENGLEGWTVVGNIGNVSSDTHYWINDPERAEGFEFGMDGNKMFSAYAPGAAESAVGTLTSSTFTVGGSGWVTFKVGAMKDGNYVYVDVVDAQTKQILARYNNGLWADRTNDVKSGCTLVAYKANLSEFIGKEVFFRISDNADSGYGLFFADSFNTYYVAEPEGFNPATPVNYQVSGTIYDLFNGGFEMGDVQGWWNNGEPGAVTGADAFFSGVAYGKDGNFLYSGVEDHNGHNGREGNVGVLTSSAFELGGSGYITYMLGGGNSICYVQVIDAVTGEILARYRQQAREDAVLKSYVADLTAYVGRTVRIQVVDNATSDWGCVSFDNVKTYYASKPEGFIDAIDVKYDLVNGSFENGHDGWKQIITEAGAHNTLGWVQSSEHDAGWYTKNDGRKDGSFLFTFCQPNGTNCENTKGTLNSATFVLKKDSYVSFRFGGAGTHDVHVQLCKANGEVIATFYNDAPGKINTEMHAYFYQYTGETTECFFRVVDNSISNYGCFVVDDFRVNLEIAPEGYIAAIQ